MSWQILTSIVTASRESCKIELEQGQIVTERVKRIVTEQVKRIVQADKKSCKQNFSIYHFKYQVLLTPNCDQIDQEQILIVTERVKRIVELEQGLIATTR